MTSSSSVLRQLAAWQASWKNGIATSKSSSILLVSLLLPLVLLLRWSADLVHVHVSVQVHLGDESPAVPNAQSTLLPGSKAAASEHEHIAPHTNAITLEGKLHEGRSGESDKAYLGQERIVQLNLSSPATSTSSLRSRLHKREQIRRWLDEAESRRRRWLRAVDEINPHHVRLRSRKDFSKCWSKGEQKIFFQREHDPEDSSRGARLQAFSDYSKLHRACTHYIKNWPEFVEKLYGDEESTGCNFILWAPPEGHGVGNRIISLVSTFIFALITDRVLLLPKDNFLAEYLCNPFDDSDWRIDNFKETMSYVRRRAKVLGEMQSPTWNKKFAAFDFSWSMQNHAWFAFCEAEMAALNSAKIVIINADNFFVPTLYYSSFLETKLNALFPDRKAFMHAARFLLHPINSVWDRILRVYRGYLEHHHTLVGVQVRFFNDDDGKADIRSRIVDCAVKEAAYLPDVLPRDEWRQMAGEIKEGPLFSPNGDSTGVFATSLNRIHVDYLKDLFTHNKPRDGSTVSVYSESHEGEEKQEVFDHYETALIEMWLLSFCDKLLVSDYSSFGYVAAGLAGITPFSLNVAIRINPTTDWRTNGRPLCVSTSSEPCLLQLPPGEPPMCGSNVTDVTSIDFIKPCKGTNYGLNVELFESFTAQ